MAQAQLPFDIGPPEPLNTNAAVDSEDDVSSSIAADGNGHLVVVWQSREDVTGTIGTDPDILFTRSADGGLTWSPPAPLNSDAETDGLNFQEVPRVATDGAGTWITVWRGQSPGGDFDLYYSRSVDHGATWSDLAELFDGAMESEDDYAPAIAAAGDVWIVSWHIQCSADELDILVTRSTNDGVDWSTPEIISDPAEQFSREPYVATDGMGRWVVGWTVIFLPDFEEDLHFAASLDDGLTWSSAAPLNVNAVGDSGADLNVNIVSAGPGQWVAAWASNEDLAGIGTDFDILVARSGDDFIWSAPEPLNSNAAIDAGYDTSVFLARDDAGGIVAVWSKDTSAKSGKVENDTDLFIARSTDGGVSWSNQQVLNTNAGVDGHQSYDREPVFTPAGNGVHVVVWRSAGDLGGEIGTDDDLLFAVLATDCAQLGWATALDASMNVTLPENALGAPDGLRASFGPAAMPPEATYSGFGSGELSLVGRFELAEFLGVGGSTMLDAEFITFEHNDPAGDDYESGTWTFDDGTNQLVVDYVINDPLPPEVLAVGAVLPEDYEDRFAIDQPVGAGDVPFMLFDLDGLDLDSPAFSVTLVTAGGGLSSPDPDAFGLFVDRAGSCDCNGNGIADTVELVDCAGDPGCQDCNHNAILDECDSATCDPEVDPGCDDCNLNGILDSCDIADMTSSDDDMDGVPDECVQFIGACSGTDDDLWSCFDNWVLDDPLVYPDNGSFVGPFNVVLDNVDDVILDVAAEINTLLMRNSAILRISDPAGPGPEPPADLTVTDAGGVANYATILIGSDRALTVAGGPLAIGQGGRLQPDPEAVGPLQATITAQTIAISEGACGSEGSMALGGSMGVATGGVVLDGPGGGDPGCCPPEIEVGGDAAMATGGFEIEGAADVLYNSSQPLSMSGDFVNHSTAPQSFDWFFGGIACEAIGAQSFEVAGREFGAKPLGFSLNFALGQLEVATGAMLTLQDTFDNDGAGQGPCTEALYVRDLVLQPTSTLFLDDVRLYYVNLDDQGGAVIPLGCGDLQQVVELAGDVVDCADWNEDGLRDDPCVWFEVVDGVCRGTPVVFADMGGQFGACPPDGAADGNDRFHALNCFANTNPNGSGGYPCEDAAPTAFNVDTGGQFGDCNPDGVCDGNDAFLAINTFQGTSSCSCTPAPVDPQPQVAPPAGSATARIALQPSAARLRAGETFAVTVSLENGLADLRGYQLHVDADGGRSGHLDLIDIVVEDHPLHPFAGLPYWRAFNIDTRQMVAGLDTPGVAARSGAYLATLLYRASPDARGQFVIALRSNPDDPDDRTTFFATPPTARIVVPARHVVVTVQSTRRAERRSN